MAAAPAPLLTHEDDESALTIRASPAGYELQITRQGLKAPYKLAVTRADLAEFGQMVLEALESRKRVADVPGPSDGKLALGAMIAPSDNGETLMLLLARQAAGGDEMEAEFVRFASRHQMSGFATALLDLGSA